MQSDFALVIEKRPVKNFWKGRGGFLPIAIVERMMQGSIEDAEQYFNGRSPEGVFAVSAHYGIARDGRVWQFVEDDDTAWSNGVLQNPDLSIGWLKEVYQEKVNCNLVTLSVDYEGYSGQALTPSQYEATLALHRQLIQRWEIEADNQHIIGHNWIDSLERSHNPGPLFPFSQLIKDLNTNPSEMAQPSAPAQPDLLAFLESPMPGAEMEVTPPAVVETEQVAAYQPETVEEPLYSPQLEAFTITPELNEEIDRDTAEPVEVEPASAEPETETAPAELSQDQPEEASAFETAAPSPVDQPEEASSFEQSLPPLPEQPEESQQAEPYTPEMTEAALPAEEVESEVVGVSEEQPAQTQAEEAFSEPAQVEEAAVAASQPAEVEEETAEAEPEAGVVEAEPSASETFQAEGQPEETLPEPVAAQEAAEPAPAEEAPEAATQAETTTPEEPAYQFENFDLDDIEAALAYQPKPTRPSPASRATAPEPAAQPAPVQETAGPILDEEAASAAQAESAPVEEVSEPGTQAETGLVEDTSEPAALAEASPTEEVAEAASQPEEGAQVETESVAYPEETAQVEPEEAVLEAVEPEAEEAALETFEPEAVAAEPVNEPENQTEVFDAPGQPEYLAQLEEATFEGVEDTAPGAAEPQVAAGQNEPGEEVAAGQNEPGEEVVEPIESGELASEQTGAEPVAGQSEAAEPVFEEAQPEEAAQPAEDSTALENYPAENAEPATSTGEQPGQDQDDWAAELFAGEAVPGFEEAATLAPKPSTEELESSVRSGAPATGELEVSPAIGNDITPKYSRPPFFDTSYTYEPTPLEITGLDEEAAEPVSDDTGVAPVEAQAVTPVEETETAGAAATQAEEAAPEPESLSEPTGTLVAQAPVEEISEPTDTIADETTEEVSEPLGQEAGAASVEEAAPPAEEAAEEVTALPAVEEAAAPVQPEEAVAVEAPVKEAATPVETEPPAGEVAPGPVATEAPVQEAAAPPAETEKPAGKRHWYDRIFNLFGGQDNKSGQTDQPGAAQEQPPTQEQPVAKEARFDSPAPATFIEPGPVQAVEAHQVSTNEPEIYQTGYATEQALFRSEDSPATGTIEAATEPARFEAATIPQPSTLPVEPTPTEVETASEAEAPAPASQPENQFETPVEAEAAPESSFTANQPETAQQTSTEPAPVEESFYPFELENTDSSNYAAYYQAGAVEEQAAGSNAFNFDLPAFEESSSAASYSQDLNNSGPSDYPFDLPTPEPSESYFQSFAPATQPAAELQPEPEAVIPPFSLEPEKAADEPLNLFDAAPSTSGRPQFDADALELPSWLDEPDNSMAEPTGEAPGSNLSTEPATPPFEPAEPATPASMETETQPSSGDFAWAGKSDQESALPGWLQNEKEEGDLPDWLKDPNGQTGVGSAQTAAPENNLPSQPVQAPTIKDAPAVEIPNKDWLENENLFEDEDFFSLLNQSGLDLSLERGGTGALPSLDSSPSGISPTSSTPAAGSASVQPEPATPASPAPSQGASSSEADFDNIFDEVPQAPAPNKVTVHQLIDRNDGYTAPLSYEDLDMSVPLGLDEDITMPGTFRPIPSEPEPAAPAAPPPPPTRADPPGFHRIPLGKGHTSVELANIRTIPSYDKSTVLRVSEQGERFEFDGWIEGPELRGSNRWYRILTPSGDEWIHSTLVQLDRPFRG